jgi:hypothetical protein
MVMAMPKAKADEWQANPTVGIRRIVVIIPIVPIVPGPVIGARCIVVVPMIAAVAIVVAAIVVTISDLLCLARRFSGG